MRWQTEYVTQETGGKKDKELFLYCHDILSACLGKGRTNKKNKEN